MAVNLTTVLNNSAGYALVEEYLQKRFLERRSFNTALVNKAYGIVRPVDKHAAQWAKYTRKRRIRRPETLASPYAGGSDPASGASLTTDQVKVPVEWYRDYIDVATTSQATSWVDLDNWSKEELPEATERRLHELVQNAFLVGRMAPFVYAADGTFTTNVDASAEASSVTNIVPGETFNFDASPKYYANGKASFADMGPEDVMNWQDMRNLHTRLGLSGAKKINGTYVAVMSESQWNDLLTDTDGGRMTAAMASGALNTAVKGLEMMTTFRYAGWTIVIDDEPFTENEGAEGVRANYGPVHSCICFGAGSFVWQPLGSESMMSPKFKVQDITKTGYSHSIGYMLPYGVAMVQPNWGAVLKSYVSQDKPNNYNPADPQDQRDGFDI